MKVAALPSRGRPREDVKRGSTILRVLRMLPAGGASQSLRLLVRGIGLACLTSALAGCVVVGPDFNRPRIALPAHWGMKYSAKQSRPAQLYRWWTRLNDPILDSLIATAVRNNLNVATAKAEIRQARANFLETRGALFPSLTGNGEATNNKMTSAGGGSTFNQYEAGFDSSWELDLFGENRRNTEAAWYGVNAANEELCSTLLTLIGDVASNYVEARGYQALAALARQTAVSQRATAVLTRKKFEAGTSSAIDTAKASAEADTTEADIPGYETSYMQAVHRIGILLGKEPDAVVRLMSRPRVIPRPRLPIPKGVPANILMARPDVRAAEWQYAQYTAKIGAAEAARYPSISLIGDVATSGTKVNDLFKASSISWTLGPTLTVPIFNGGSLKAAVAAAKAARDQYYLAFRSTVLNALEDVENASVGLTQEQIKLRKLHAAVSSYQEANRLALSLYRNGSYSFLDVLDAQRSLYAAQEALIQSRVDLATYYIALNKALGGGWDGAMDSSRPVLIDVNDGPHWLSSNRGSKS